MEILEIEDLQVGFVSIFERILCSGALGSRVVALSSTESEHKAVSQVATEIAWLRSLLGEILISYNCPAKV